MSQSWRPPVLFFLSFGYVLITSAFPASVLWAQGVLVALIAVGLVIIGIPHGALDVWTFQHRAETGAKARYITGYLMAIGGVFWFWQTFPVAGLLLFLCLSAWHFGQADGALWGLTKVESAVWGAWLLSMMLVWHTEEMNAILVHMGILHEQLSRLAVHLEPVQGFTVLGWVAAAAWAAKRSNWNWLWCIGMLAAAPWTPLLLMFGLYFVGQHSAAGWHHLKSRLGQSSWQLWRKAIPFSLGAWLLIGAGLGWMTFESPSDVDATAGAFFVLLGSISIPHIFESHLFLFNAAEGSTP